MSRQKKLVERLRRNPKNVRFEEIETLLTGLGFTLRKNGSSHKVFERNGYPHITVPFRKPFLLPPYVKQVLELIAPLLDEFEE